MHLENDIALLLPPTPQLRRIFGGCYAPRICVHSAALRSVSEERCFLWLAKRSRDLRPTSCRTSCLCNGVAARLRASTERANVIQRVKASDIHLGFIFWDMLLIIMMPQHHLLSVSILYEWCSFLMDSRCSTCNRETVRVHVRGSLVLHSHSLPAGDGRMYILYVRFLGSASQRPAFIVRGRVTVHGLVTKETHTRADTSIYTTGWRTCRLVDVKCHKIKFHGHQPQIHNSTPKWRHNDKSNTLVTRVAKSKTEHKYYYVKLLF